MNSLPKYKLSTNDVLMLIELLANHIEPNGNDSSEALGIINISLIYYEGYPVIKEIKRISKPGRRVYSRATSIPKVMNGLGLAILSTPKGVMTDTEARKNNVGGEIICRVF